MIKIGQYFLVVDLDKKQFLHPHTFGDGLKLLEFGCSADGTMTALALLLRKSNEGGGGDYHGDSDLVGSWAEDRIVIIGDYDKSGLYEKAEKFEDISEKIFRVMQQEGIVRPESERPFSLRPDMVLTGKE